MYLNPFQQDSVSVRYEETSLRIKKYPYLLTWSNIYKESLLIYKETFILYKETS